VESLWFKRLDAFDDGLLSRTAEIIESSGSPGFTPLENVKREPKNVIWYDSRLAYASLQLISDRPATGHAFLRVCGIWGCSLSIKLRKNRTVHLTDLPQDGIFEFARSQSQASIWCVADVPPWGPLSFPLADHTPKLVGLPQKRKGGSSQDEVPPSQDGEVGSAEVLPDEKSGERNL
jgi:hypothetical protein